MSSRNLKETRSRILDAAWAMLETGDPKKSRMGDIAKAAGVSRQAVYLHFPGRAELLVATARHLDEVHKIDEQLEASRTAETGIELLDAFIEAFGNHIPNVVGVARAFIAMMDNDAEAKAAWHDRLKAIRHGCKAAVRDLHRDGHLQEHWSQKTATDWLWALLSVQQWEMLVRECGWSQTRYIECMKRTAHLTLVRQD